MPEDDSQNPDRVASAQIDRFKEAARRLGCDEDEAVFDEKLKAVARQVSKGEGQQSGK